jgi:hypothetical protein
VNTQLITAFLFLIFLCSCNGQDLEINKYQIKKLEGAENEKDIIQIQKIFHEDAILYTSELMPVKFIEGISSVYEFVFLQNDVERVMFSFLMYTACHWKYYVISKRSK